MSISQILLVLPDPPGSTMDRDEALRCKLEEAMLHNNSSSLSTPPWVMLKLLKRGDRLRRIDRKKAIGAEGHSIPI
jgi:hypothetical protein